jgi:hypothetical protein
MGHSRQKSEVHEIYIWSFISNLQTAHFMSSKKADLLKLLSNLSLLCLQYNQKWNILQVTGGVYYQNNMKHVSTLCNKLQCFLMVKRTVIILHWVFNILVDSWAEILWKCEMKIPVRLSYPVACLKIFGQLQLEILLIGTFIIIKCI